MNLRHITSPTKIFTYRYHGYRNAEIEIITVVGSGNKKWLHMPHSTGFKIPLRVRL